MATVATYIFSGYDKALQGTSGSIYLYGVGGQAFSDPGATYYNGHASSDISFLDGLNNGTTSNSFLGGDTVTPYLDSGGNNHSIRFTSESAYASYDLYDSSGNIVAEYNPGQVGT